MTVSNSIKYTVHLLNDRVVTGGVATIMGILSKAIGDNGGQVRLWTNSGNASHVSSTVPYGRLGFGLAGVGKLLTLLCSPIPLALIKQVLRDRLQGRRPVIHLNTPYLPCAISAISASLLTRTPLVYTVHANKSHISGMYWKVEQIIYFFSSTFILELAASRNDYAKKKAGKMIFIPFGVESKNAELRWSAVDAEEFTFIAVNRLDHNRMVDVFIKAFYLQKDRNKSRLRIVGDGQQKEELIALAADLGCAERIEFLPVVEESEIQNLLVKCNCFVTLSAGGDVGMAAKIAAGVGMPCLAYEFASATEDFYSATSVESLSQKMAAVAAMSLADLQAYAVKTTANLRSDAESMAAKYLAAYDGRKK